MIEKLEVCMSSLNRKRTVRVYLPRNYSQEGKSYPVLYMHDGQNIFFDEEAIRGVSLGMEEYIDGSGLDIIVVGIDLNSEGEERINEYCPWKNGEFSKRYFGITSSSGGKGEAYLDFIVHQLKPFIDNHYRTLKNRTSIAGISLGGLISTYAACRYPHIFSRVAILSSAFYRNQDEIENLIKNADLSSLDRFYMDCGTREAAGEDKISELFLNSNKSVYSILSQKVSNIKFEILEDAEHHYSFFKKRIPAILSFLFAEATTAK